MGHGCEVMPHGSDISANAISMSSLAISADFSTFLLQGLALDRVQVYTTSIGGGAACEAREGMVFDKSVVGERSCREEAGRQPASGDEWSDDSTPAPGVAKRREFRNAFARFFPVGELRNSERFATLSENFAQKK